MATLAKLTVPIWPGCSAIARLVAGPFIYQGVSARGGSRINFNTLQVSKPVRSRWLSHHALIDMMSAVTDLPQKLSLFRISIDLPKPDNERGFASPHGVRLKAPTIGLCA